MFALTFIKKCQFCSQTCRWGCDFCWKQGKQEKKRKKKSFFISSTSFIFSFTINQTTKSRSYETVLKTSSDLPSNFIIPSVSPAGASERVSEREEETKGDGN